MKEKTGWMSGEYSQRNIRRANLLAGIFNSSRAEILRRALDDYLDKHLPSSIEEDARLLFEDENEAQK